MSIVRFLFICIFFIVNISFGFAETKISINDTIIPRGSIYKIPVYFEYNEVNLNNVVIEFEFNQYVIDIKSAISSPEDIFQCQPMNLITDLTETPAKAIIDCNKINLNSTNRIAFYLFIEGLTSSDSISLIDFTKVILNDSIVEFINGSGEVKVPGDPIFQKDNEVLGNNYPNPFSINTFIPFTIDKDTDVNFCLYSADGRKVIDEIEFKRLSKLFKFDKDLGRVFLSDFASHLEKGRYEIEFSPTFWQLARGMYFIVMKTDNNFFSHKIMLEK